MRKPRPVEYRHADPLVVNRLVGEQRCGCGDKTEFQCVIVKHGSISCWLFCRACWITVRFLSEASYGRRSESDFEAEADCDVDQEP